jgi:hypothetical protein
VLQEPRDALAAVDTDVAGGRPAIQARQTARLDEQTEDVGRVVLELV